MADQRAGGIAWTDATWNPIRGCTRVSEGCRNCYAETVAARFSDKGMAYEGLAKRTPSGPRWTGNIAVVDDHMADPLRWTRPRRVFVNSMSDLFHERLTDAQIARVFAVMYLAPQHTFQVLTKRAARMRQVLTSPGFYRLVLDHADAFRRDFPHKGLLSVAISDPTKFPHQNVWLGVSVEDQKAANGRVPELLATPAAVRWLSVEPQIGEVDLCPLTCPDCGEHDVSQGVVDGVLSQPWCAECDTEMGDPDWLGIEAIDWVVVGGESGTNARPFDVAWADLLVRQCRGAGVAVFVKQLGAVPYDSREAGPGDEPHPGGPGADPDCRLNLVSPKGGDMDEWPESLRVREFPR